MSSWRCQNLEMLSKSMTLKLKRFQHTSRHVKMCAASGHAIYFEGKRSLGELPRLKNLVVKNISCSQNLVSWVLKGL